MGEPEIKVKLVVEPDKASASAAGAQMASAAQAAANAFGKGGLATPGGAAGLTNVANVFNRKSRGAWADAIQDQEKALKFQKKQVKDHVTFMKDMSFLMMPMFNPGSVWATLFSTRQTFSAMNTEKGQGMMAKLGMNGIGGAAMATGALVGGATALGIAFTALKKTVEGAGDAIKKGFNLYTGAAQAGLNTGFYTQRQTAANVLGIQGNPNQVFMFGKAVQYVMERTSQANKILSQTARPLAGVEMNFRILKLDMDALYASIAVKAAPALNNLINVMDLFVITATKMSGAVQLLGRSAISAFIANHPILGGLAKMAGYAGSVMGKGGTPPMMPTMKQLPAATWEHMGLMIGGSGNNPAAQTAKNTGQMVKILAAMMRGNRGGSAVQFGLNPLVSNP